MRKIPSLREVIDERIALRNRQKAVPAVPARVASAVPSTVTPPPLSLASTDDLTEGVINLYHQDARVYTWLKSAMASTASVTVTYDDEAQTITLTSSGGDIAGTIHVADEKTTPVDADEVGIVDSEAANTLKRLTWANIKATLKAYFDNIYSALFDQSLNTEDAPQFAGLTLTDALTHAFASTGDVVLRTNAGEDHDGFIEFHALNYPGGEGETKDYIVTEKTDYNHAAPDGGYVWIGTGTGGTVEWLRVDANGVRATIGLLAPDGTPADVSQYYGTDGDGVQGYHNLPAGGDPATAIHAADSKATPDDADEWGFLTSVGGAFTLVKMTWGTLITVLTGIFDLLYSAIDHTHSHADLTDLDADDHPQYLLAANAPTAATATSAAMWLVVATDGNDSNNGSATAIAGTVSVTSGSATVTGSGTAFLTALAVGNYILVNNEARKIQSITNDTSLATTTTFSATLGSLPCYKCTAPKLTVQGAVNAIPQFVNHAVVLAIAPGTYAEDVTIAGFAGKGSITVRGAKSTTTTHQIQALTASQCGCTLLVYGLGITTTTGTCTTVNACQIVYLQNINMVGSGAFYGLYVTYSNVYIASSTISNRSVAFAGSSMARILTQTISGSSNTIVVSAASGAIVQHSNSTLPSGTTAESYSNGGVIIRQSGGVIGTA